ncbi:MAG TPA: SIMPL domain-containing protein [Candidatus Limnocylindrales bacterium]
MSTHFRTVAAAGLAALAVAAMTLVLRPAPALGAPTDPSQPPARTITVSASSHVTLVPDVAHVGLGITATKPTVEAARAEAARVMNAVIAAARDKGVAERDIRTTSVYLSPQYAPNCTYAPDGSSCAKPNAIVGYTMNEEVDVTVRNLDVAGAVVDAATAAGATNVNGISFTVDDPDKAATDAEVAAIGAARSKAEAMAQAAGVSLGRVMSMSESPVAIPYPYPYAGAAPARDAATPVQPGTQDVTATVTMVFELA